MKDLTHYLITHLVDNPDEVTIEETENEHGAMIITIHVAQTDMGRIIGKEGKVIRAIRDLVKILAVKENKHVDVVLAE